MNYHYIFSIGTGGLGLLGRVLVAVAILLVMKKLDKDNAAYNKGLKWLAAGSGICVVLLVLVFSFFIGMMGAAVINPFFYW